MRASRPPAPAALLVAALPLVAALAAGCTDAWRTVEFVEGLRVLGIRAEPPDLRPGEWSTLDALVVDPRDPTRVNTLIWLACHPDPTSLDQPRCAQYATLESLNGTDGSADPATIPDDLVPLGMTAPAGAPKLSIVYPAPADVFANVAADDPRRQKGVLAIVLMLAIAEPPPERWPPTKEDLQLLLARVRAKQVDSVLSIKRLRISETATPNHNPVLSKIRLGDGEWGPGTRPAKVWPGVWNELTALPADGSTETYLDLDADGNEVTKVEHLSVSWFTTVGGLNNARTLAGELEKPEKLYAPYVLQEVPEDRLGTLYAVMRDGRGGADPFVLPFFICDPNRAPPSVTSLEPASGPPGTVVRIQGTGLDDLIDAGAGSDALGSAAWDEASQAYVGTIPARAAVGELAIVPRGKGCAPDPSGTFTVTAKK